MAFVSSSSSGDQQVVLCGSHYVHVFKSNNNNSPEVSAGLQSQAATTTHEQNDTAAAFIDVTVEEEEQPPYVIVVHGPRKVGKSLLIKSLVEHYTKENLHVSYTQGLITIVSGEQRRLQFVECPNNVNGMLDAAKYADAVILLIDADVGFEMETFEFVDILRVHGMPKVMGVLTSLDMFENVETLAETKEDLMNHFYTEICEGATLFCLSGLEHGMYPKHEIRDLAGFISAMKFHPLSWRAAQPYVLVDRFQDVTHPERRHMDNKCACSDRDILLYGYLRGCDLKKGTKVHIAGVGDFPLFGVTSSVDPCPLLAAPKRKRSEEGKEHDESDGFRPGTYLRLKVRDVPFEMVENNAPYHPILVGVIKPGEENVGYMQATLKRHTWHKKLLKTGYPVIVSMGWRRYETIPIYAMEDRSKRLRMLNYTPFSMLCLATFWGPLASPNTGVVVVQSLPEKKAAFRILATAVVVDFNHAAKIMKKCKRPGTPCKIFGKTALIKGLFKSDHDMDRFKDAKLWTESGIQGKVKKVAEKVCVDGPRRKDGLLREGIAKCTFKRIICMRDTILMRVWKEVEVPRFFNPLETAPEPIDRTWLYVKPVEELRQSHSPPMLGLLDGPEEFPEGDLFKQANEDSEMKPEELEFPEGELFEQAIEEKGVKDYPVYRRQVLERELSKQEIAQKNVKGVWRRQTLERQRTVRFFEGEPSFRDRTFAKKTELAYYNKAEQKEFEKHPVLVISKEEEMLEERQISELGKECLEEFMKLRFAIKLDCSSQEHSCTEE